MNIHFEPAELECAPSAETFIQVVRQMTDGLSGEVRVLQNYRGEPTRIIIIAPGHGPVSTEVPHRWFHQALLRDEIDTTFERLLNRLPTPAR